VLIAYGGTSPRVDPSAYVQQSAQVIGDVRIGPQCSVWFHVVIRADVHHSRIGARTNIQDNATIHVPHDRRPTIVGEEVTVAHGVILHGCTVGDRSLIGIGAIVLDGSEIGEECLVGAGSLVAPGSVLPGGHLVLGIPAKVVRSLNDAELEQLRGSAASYVAYAERYQTQKIL